MPRGSRKGVDLLPIREVEIVAGDNLAANTQITWLAQVIENVNSNEDYGSGSIKGLRVALQVFPGAQISIGPRCVVMILPSGMTVPSVVTAAEVKQAERFIWGEKALMPIGDPTATNLWAAELLLKTARRFHSGDLLTFVLINEDPGTAYGAAVDAYILGRVYVTED